MSVLPVANDKVQLTSSAGTNYQNGVLMSGASAVYAISSPSVWSNGIYRTADGAIYVFNATAGMPSGFTWSNGLPFSALGALCVSTNAVASWSNGIPFDANGAVVADFNIPAPALNLDFTNGILDSRITFTRTSGATYTDSTGVLRTTANNLSLWSQTFQNAFWDKGLTTVVDNSTIAPDGTQTAALFSEAAGTGSHHIHDLTGNFTPTVASSYCMSIYVKQPSTAADRYLQLAFWTAGFGANAYLNFDLQTKTTATIGSAITSSGVEVLSAGWMRIWAVAPATVAAASGFQLIFVSSGTAVRAESYTVTAGSEESTYIWGAQVAQSAVLTPYVRNEGTASGAPRFDYDPVTLSAKGLLIEEQRTNTIRNNSMVGASAGTPGTAPTNWVLSGNVNGLTQTVVGTGTENGVSYIDLRLVGTTSATSAHTFAFEAANFIAASSGQTWVRSLFLKIVSGSVTNLMVNNLMQGRDSGNTTFTESFVSDLTSLINSTLTRYSASSTLASASTAFARSALSISYNSGAAIDITLRIGYPQLELGSFATSVIPTTSAQATRAADVAVISGANFSSWYNQSEGTLYAEADSLHSISYTSEQYLFAVSDGTVNSYIRMTRVNSSNRGYGAVGGVTQFDLNNGTFTTSSKLALAYKLNDVGFSSNGGAAVADSTATMPTVDRASIGAYTNGFGPLNGHIKAIAYYNTRLTNTQLQTLTT